MCSTAQGRTSHAASETTLCMLEEGSPNSQARSESGSDISEAKSFRGKSSQTSKDGGVSSYTVVFTSRYYYYFVVLPLRMNSILGNTARWFKHKPSDVAYKSAKKARMRAEIYQA
ncbi:hypothetical protein GQ600_20919 [Phytophthora cactorum]|nr:hypothetical protein GQ600_20919 [Phytophthora cactorum]